MTKTQRERELLGFIHGYIAEHGIAPTYTESAKALGIRSKSAIHRMMAGLEAGAFIRQIPGRARAVEVIRRPDDVPPEPPRLVRVPFHGFIGAGVPAESIKRSLGWITVPSQTLKL